MPIDPNNVEIKKLSDFPGAPALDGLYFAMFNPLTGNYRVPESLYRRVANSYSQSETNTAIQAAINAFLVAGKVEFVVGDGTVEPDSTEYTDPDFKGKPLTIFNSISPGALIYGTHYNRYDSSNPSIEDTVGDTVRLLFPVAFFMDSSWTFLGGIAYTSSQNLTSGQRNALVNPPEGMEVYDTTLKKKCFYNGSEWEQINSTIIP